MKRGDKVYVITSTSFDHYEIEGVATLLRSLGYGQWIVKFPGDKEHHQRFIDPKAQSDPYSYVAELNSSNQKS